MVGAALSFEYLLSRHSDCVKINNLSFCCPRRIIPRQYNGLVIVLTPEYGCNTIVSISFDGDCDSNSLCATTGAGVVRFVEYVEDTTSERPLIGSVVIMGS